MTDVGTVVYQPKRIAFALLDLVDFSSRFLLVLAQGLVGNLGYLIIPLNSRNGRNSGALRVHINGMTAAWCTCTLLALVGLVANRLTGT